MLMMDQSKIYERARLNNKLGFGKKPALIIVDLINGFTNPQMPLGSDLSNVIDATNKIIEQCRVKDVPVIFATIAFNPNKLDGGLWVKKAPAQGEFVFGSDLIKVDERMDYQPEKDTYLIKKYASCFAGTDLAATLSALGTDTVIITGATTSGCVRATAVDALQNGFIPIVPKQAVGDRAQGPHEASLFDINAKYGDVVDLDDVINYLKELDS